MIVIQTIGDSHPVVIDARVPASRRRRRAGLAALVRALGRSAHGDPRPRHYLLRSCFVRDA